MSSSPFPWTFKFPLHFSFILSPLKMSLLSSPSTINHCNKIISSSIQFSSQTTHNLNSFSVRHTSLYPPSFSSPLPSQFLIKPASSSTHRGSTLVPFDAKTTDAESGSTDHEDHRALHAVLRLYSAIKSQNIRELSDIIGEECRCVCNFISFFQPFQGKKVHKISINKKIEFTLLILDWISV